MSKVLAINNGSCAIGILFASVEHFLDFHVVRNVSVLDMSEILPDKNGFVADASINLDMCEGFMYFHFEIE